MHKTSDQNYPHWPAHFPTVGAGRAAHTARDVCGGKGSDLQQNARRVSPVSRLRGPFGPAPVTGSSDECHAGPGDQDRAQAVECYQDAGEPFRVVHWLHPRLFTPLWRALAEPRYRGRPRSRIPAGLISVFAILTLVAGPLVVTARAAQATGALPCDIFAQDGTSCAAAYSTVRALYSYYDGPLYQVQRASDNATANVGLQSAGGYVNAAEQDSFCSGTTCTITGL
jgi:hypothetical protein